MSSSVLQEICARKAEHVALKKSQTPVEGLKDKAAHAPAPKGFINAIREKQGAALIAEVKKASPSKGIIRENFNPADIAKIYEDNGAACISCLTDEPYFQGKDEYLQTIRKEVAIPLLRKDFMIDPYQIYESRALGADCILIIMAALTDDKAAELYTLTSDLGMDSLIEIHNEEELERANKLKAKMIGVNNRNLKTLEVDIQTSFDLFEQIPDDCIKVAESGISDADTIQKLHEKGYDAFLIGESLMRQDNIAAAVKKLFP